MWLVSVPLSDPKAPNVVVTGLTLMCETAPEPLTLDLTGGSRRAGSGSPCTSTETPGERGLVT